MASPLFTISRSFTIANMGLVIAPGVSSPHKCLNLSAKLQLVTPSGKRHLVSIKSFANADHKDEEKRCAIIINETLTAADIPVDTLVYLADDY